MTKKEQDIIKDMPKVILHLHLDGSLRPKTVYNWLKEQGENYLENEVKEQLIVEKDCRDLNQYLKRFNLPLKVLQTAEHIEQATYELFQDLANQGVIYAEIRFAPCKHLERGLSIEQAIESAIKGMEKAKNEFGIKGNLILCCMRGDSKENNVKVIKNAKRYLNKGVCGIDLAGAEALFPTEDYKDIFKMAKESNIPFTIHAGEADGVGSIKSAIEMGAKRIGHGVRCIEDEEVINILKEKEIILEVCPTSNLQTKAVPEPHPIEKLYNAGLKVTLSPDNSTVSNISIVEEYENVLKTTSLSINDLEQMNIYALEGAFIS